MRLLLIISLFFSVAANGQHMFWQLNHTAAVVTPYSAPPVTSGLISDYDADFGVALAGSEVIQWSDQVGTNHLVAQPRRPTLTTSAINGHNAIDFFDGLEDKKLDFTTPLTGTMTFFVVGTYNYSGEVIMNKDVGEYLIFSSTSLSYSGAISYSHTFNAGAFYTLSGYATSGGNRAIGVNGGYSSEGSGAINFNYVGGYGFSNTYKGDITRIIIYNRQLTVAELASVNGYLQTRYNHY